MKTLTNIISIALIACLLVIVVETVQRSNCICSLLSETEERYPITEHLASVWDIDTADEGTFVYITTKCDHGTQVCLRIFPDAGYIIGHIIR